MAESTNRDLRERLTSSLGIPETPRLESGSGPRKRDSTALSVGSRFRALWGRGRVRRRIRTAPERMAADVGPPHLDELARERMLITMVGWRFDRGTSSFVTDDVTPERMDALIHAVIALGPRVVQLNVAGLSREQYLEVVDHLAEGSWLTITPVLDERLGSA